MIKDFENISIKDYSPTEYAYINRQAKEHSASKFADLGTKQQVMKLLMDYEAQINTTPKTQTIDIETKERDELRKKIIQEYLEKFEAEKKEKKATIIIGQIACGKSTLSNEVLEKDKGMIVDSDIIKQGSGDFEGLKEDYDHGKGVWAIHEETSYLQREIFKQAILRGDNIVLPRVAKNFHSFMMKDLIPLIKNGYTVDLAYIDVVPELSMQRNYERFLQGVRVGNPRLVPLKVMNEIDDKPFRTFCSIKQIKNRCNPDICDNLKAYSSQKDGANSLEEIDLNTMHEKFYKFDCMER